MFAFGNPTEWECPQAKKLRRVLNSRLSVVNTYFNSDKWRR